MPIIDMKNLNNLVNNDYSLLTVLYDKKNNQSSCFVFLNFDQEIKQNFNSFDKIPPIQLFNKTKESFDGMINCSFIDNPNYLFAGLNSPEDNPNLIDILTGNGSKIFSMNNKKPEIISIDNIISKEKNIPYIVTSDSELILLSNKKNIVSFKDKKNILKSHSFLTHNNISYLFAYCKEKIPEYKLFNVNEGLTEIGSIKNFLDNNKKYNIIKYKDFFITDTNGNQLSLFIPEQKISINPLLNKESINKNNKIKRYIYTRIEKSLKQNSLYNSFEIIPSINNETIQYIASYTDKNNINNLEYGIINIEKQKNNYFKNIKMHPKIKDNKIIHLKLIYNQKLQKKISLYNKLYN
jgi:hypothetical protein